MDWVLLLQARRRHLVVVYRVKRSVATGFRIRATPELRKSNLSLRLSIKRNGVKLQHVTIAADSGSVDARHGN